MMCKKIVKPETVVTNIEDNDKQKTFDEKANEKFSQTESYESRETIVDSQNRRVYSDVDDDSVDTLTEYNTSDSRLEDFLRKRRERKAAKEKERHERDAAKQAEKLRLEKEKLERETAKQKEKNKQMIDALLPSLQEVITSSIKAQFKEIALKQQYTIDLKKKIESLTNSQNKTKAELVRVKSENEQLKNENANLSEQANELLDQIAVLQQKKSQKDEFYKHPIEDYFPEIDAAFSYAESCSYDPNNPEASFRTQQQKLREIMKSIAIYRSQRR